MSSAKAKRLGAYLQKQRQVRGLSLRDLAVLADVNFRTIGRFEEGAYEKPDAGKLARIANALRLPLADIYSIAGYASPNDLPSPVIYFRTKYRDLPAKTVDELTRGVKALLAEQGIDLRSGPAPGEDETAEEIRRLRQRAKERPSRSGVSGRTFGKAGTSNKKGGRNESFIN